MLALDTYSQLSVKHLPRYANEFSGRDDSCPLDTQEPMTRAGSLLRPESLVLGFILILLIFVLAMLYVSIAQAEPESALVAVPVPTLQPVYLDCTC